MGLSPTTRHGAPDLSEGAADNLRNEDVMNWLGMLV